jgi:NADH-quinone oxidoreductase subunit G
MHHIFGSDELSLAAPGIGELAAVPHVAVNGADFSEGQKVAVRCAGSTFQLPVHIRPDLPVGVAGLPAGVFPVVGLDLPVWGRIERLR